MSATHALKMLTRLNTNNILQISSTVSVSVTGIVSEKEESEKYREMADMKARMVSDL